MLMQKVFLQLLHELKTLGAKIVYATFNRIIVATNKTSLDDARTYWNFIHTTLFRNDLFSWLALEPSQWWQVLLFSDVTNLGGVAEVPEGGDPAEPPIVSNWNLAEYLPPPVDQSFILTIGEYLMNLWAQSQHKGTTETTAAAESSPKKAKQSGLISSDLTQRLFHAVTLLHKSKMQTPVHKNLPGADRISNQAPALQFVTTVTHILALDKQNAMAVFNLKRDLLKLIGVDDFSPAAEFVDPAPSYVLQDLICDFCAHPHNLDLLRDPLLLNHSWECAWSNRISR